jgi:hypothetical protein
VAMRQERRPAPPAAATRFSPVYQASVAQHLPGHCPVLQAPGGPHSRSETLARSLFRSSRTLVPSTPASLATSRLPESKQCVGKGAKCHNPALGPRPRSCALPPAGRKRKEATTIPHSYSTSQCYFFIGIRVASCPDLQHLHRCRHMSAIAVRAAVAAAAAASRRADIPRSAAVPRRLKRRSAATAAGGGTLMAAAATQADAASQPGPPVLLLDGERCSVSSCIELAQVLTWRLVLLPVGPCPAGLQP